MSEQPAPAEFVTIPELGVKRAFVVHLRLDSGPRRQLCDGRLAAEEPMYDRPGGGNPIPLHPAVLCRACLAASRRAP